MNGMIPVIVYHKNRPDRNDWGIALGTETFTTFETVEGNTVPMTSSRVLVAWNASDMRSAGFPAMHAPEELVWDSIPDLTTPNPFIPDEEALDIEALKNWFAAKGIDISDMPEDQLELFRDLEET
ncbi:MAG: hypothetical protein SFU25_12050 [Candidatus Caenarcaniphilales bacterium]|nr:hypothetical protein [Candidatus Caenarcaniphilales bacterium]